MRCFRPALTALLIGAAAPALIAPAFAQTCACPTTDGFAPGPVIQAEEPPPPLPVYEQPPLPEPGYIWTPGYWAWNNYDYYWVPGVWVAPPQAGVLWTPGYWAFVGGAYLFHQGYWGPHVGFYGGVNYGYGYNGLAYEGGRWEGGRFVYNTTVNNFGSVRMTNVYTQNVTVAPGAARVSYNGGPGGIALRPTPEQERLTTEEHVRPTQLQVTQARTASMDAMQFHSANQGKPAVAATARPGELKGPGAVPAKAAGSAELQPAQGPNGGQKLAPGAAPPGAAPNLEHRLPSGATLPPGAAPGAPGQPQRMNPEEKPQSPVRSEEKLPPKGAPAELKPPAGEKPSRPEPGAERPQGAERPALQKPLERPQQVQRPEPPRVMERPAAPPAPHIEAMPAAPPAPHIEARPEGQPHAQPRPAPQNRPERAECGRPGLPPCPK